MAEALRLNPAEVAAEKALGEMFHCINERQNFRLEAGAGAGKTYSLVKALKQIVNEQGIKLQRHRQQVACITYTNVATDEIISRTDAHPVIHASTIHAFCWGLIRGFQPFLRAKIPEMSSWIEKLAEAGGVGMRQIDYDLGHRRIKDEYLYLHHDDVIALAVKLMQEAKFRQILTARFPILFIDEYQDTNKAFAASIVEHFVGPKDGPLIGLFGDSWQKIYGDGSGVIEHPSLKPIGKGANFRSVKEVVHMLNRMRPDLPQEIKDVTESGSIAVYHSNNWAGSRRTGSHWAGDLLPADSHLFLETVRGQLMGEGWDFAPKDTKILMLTHNILAQEQHYKRIADVFPFNDSFIKKEDPYISFLVDTIEPVCLAFQGGRYGEMFSTLGARSVTIRNLGDKQTWARSIGKLISLRETGTIGHVIDLLKETHRPRLPEAIQRREAELLTATPEAIEQSPALTQAIKLRNIPYSELSALALFVNDHTPFSTKHGVKGAEFDNVLVVFGRGWNQYDWNQFLELSSTGAPANKAEFFERNRNLFYVVCSRSKKRLTLLFTQKLSTTALATLQCWFGRENVQPIEVVQSSTQR